MQFMNPTGKGVRNDAEGSGLFGARRGKRRHNGIDFICIPGQVIIMPVAGTIVRESLPYKDDLKWRGVYIVGKRIELQMWYFTPHAHLIGQRCDAGDDIGVAQDIGDKYEGMLAHIHMRIVKIDPALLFPLDPLDYDAGVI